MEDQLTIAVDLHSEWVENPTRYTWRSKGQETVPIKICENIMCNELVEIIISRFELNCDKDDLSITYMLGFIEKQKGPPSRIRDDRDLRFFFKDRSRPILRIYVVERIAKIKIMANKYLGNKLLVHQVDEDTFSVTANNGIIMVHLRSKICSCREFD
ncbi:hypothetical protein H5410_056832 [Solanum commersonii]|uniref:Uncharacterized protein n=1 Tax=Solanum commersonii TaxID=4109 RepID=A0A9J5WME6_SOLCO|nr:hypothetical protein H5410_056832 [Solanum commersonii]